MGRKAGNVTVELTGSEAIVLFEFLLRFVDHEELTIRDQSEQRVLWDICAVLERSLTPPLDPDYAELLHRARLTLRDRES